MSKLNHFNKFQIQRNFNKAASVYKKKARLQRIVAQKLIDLNLSDLSKAKNILDLGSGPGLLSELMVEKKKVIQIDIAYEMLKLSSIKYNLNINADIEYLPLKKAQFELIISSLSFQWLNDIGSVLERILFLLKKNGVFSCALVIDGSLAELKTATRECQVNLNINNFPTINQINKILSGLNKCQFQATTEKIILDYQDLRDLLRSIKIIGAGYSSVANRHFNKNDFKKLNDFYLKNFNFNNKVVASWQICYINLKTLNFDDNHS